MFDSQYVGDIISAARQNGIDPAGLLAVVEVESRAKAFEADGVTPIFLFERHVFFRQLQDRAPSKLQLAVSQGLANNGPKAGQYNDQKPSSAKLALLERARAIDVTCANRSCSWGVGQTMGFHAESFGFANVGAMLDFLKSGGVPAQIDLMVRFIKMSKLVSVLNSHDWAGFARVYNGAGFKKNNYDVKLAEAFTKWSKFVGTLGPDELPAAPAPSTGPFARGDRGDGVVALQAQLKQLGLLTASADGLFGPITEQAVISFQRSKNLPVTGRVDRPTLDALTAATAPSPPITPDLLSDIITIIQPKPPIPATDTNAPVLSPIDSMLGGPALAGKKSPLALLAYVILSILQSANVVGTATGDWDPSTAQAQHAAVSPPAGSTAGTQVTPVPTAAKAPVSPVSTPNSAPAAQPTTQPATVSSVPATGSKTPTGQILTTLILAFGALGLLGKFDRIAKLSGRIASKPG